MSAASNPALAHAEPTPTETGGELLPPDAQEFAGIAVSEMVSVMAAAIRAAETRGFRLAVDACAERIEANVTDWRRSHDPSLPNPYSPQALALSCEQLLAAAADLRKNVSPPSSPAP